MFSPVNTIIFFVTLISFIISLLILFIFFLGEYYQSIILDKIELISLYAKNNDAFKQKLIQEIDTFNASDSKVKAIEEEVSRKEHNIKALNTHGPGPFLYIICAVAFIYFLTLIIRKIRGQQIGFEGSDYLLLLFAMLSFSVEIVFYFVIIQSWKIVPDSEIIKIIIETPAGSQGLGH